MKQFIIVILILLSFVSPALAGDLGFDDFIPADPTQEMKTKLQKYREYFFTGLDGKSAKRVKVKIDEIMKEK